MTRSLVTSILSMLITLAMAYGIDDWIHLQDRYARMSSNFQQPYIWEIFGGLVLLAAWVVLGWIVLNKLQRSTIISAIYIFTGLLAFIWFPLELISRFWSSYLYVFGFSPSRLQYSGLFIAALGCLTLLLPKHKPA